MTTYADDDSGGGDTGLLAGFKTTAIAAAGLSESTFVSYFDDFFLASRFVASAGGGGTVNLTATPEEGAGAILCTTSAGGSSRCTFNAQVGFLSDLRQKNWYMRSRARFTTALDAAAGGGIGFQSAAGLDLTIGYVGPTSTTQWVILGGGTGLFTAAGGAVIPGTTVDTTMHTWEMWYIQSSNTLFGRVDGGTTASIAFGGGGNYAGVNLYVSGGVANGGTLAARGYLCEYVYWAMS